MHLYDIPMICVLIGLALYAVLGGADFGAGLWQLATLIAPGRSPEGRDRAEQLREHAHHSMGPVWEANHVWLIFVLTVMWTGYPAAFGAIASTLAVPLLIAGVGIVFRGAAYALRSGTGSAAEAGIIDTIFSLSSILTPFALGTVVGAIVLQRVPVGNAAGGLFSSWTAPSCLLLGALSVAVCAYMAAVYLAADAARHDRAALREAFRRRALGAGAVAGALAIALLPVLHADAHHFFERLVTGPGLVGVVISAVGGVGTLVLVAGRRLESARASAAIAVAGLIIGWALAQQPSLLRGLTLGQAAAPRSTQIVLLAAIAMGAVILFPSLGLLFSLQLRGRFDSADSAASAAPAGSRDSGDSSGEPAEGRPPGLAGVLARSRPRLAARVAIAGLIGGFGLLTVADAPWAHGIGVGSFVVCAIAAFVAVDPAEMAAVDPGSPGIAADAPGDRDHTGT